MHDWSDLLCFPGPMYYQTSLLPMNQGELPDIECCSTDEKVKKTGLFWCLAISPLCCPPPPDV